MRLIAALTAAATAFRTALRQAPPAEAETTAELPVRLTDAETEEAIAQFLAARESGNAAERVQRKLRPLVPAQAGVYGAFRVEYVATSRTVPDEGAIAAFYAAHQGGSVPRKPVAPSLKVTFLGERVPAAA